jgi:hypothetical protein
MTGDVTFLQRVIDFALTDSVRFRRYGARVLVGLVLKAGMTIAERG